jgi:hypothetical protein
MTRCRLETATIGSAGGIISSTVDPQVQAVFPEGALMKTIKVGLQVNDINTFTLFYRYYRSLHLGITF